jgi:hypothetical protein
MSERNDSGSAFPVLPPVDETGRSAVGYPFPDPGMSLRDYFAAKAMQGLIAQARGTATSSQAVLGATWAYEMADAMLAAREL